jgi:hypothetical protein
VQPFGGAAEGARVDHSKQVLEMLKIHRSSFSFS